MTSHVFPFMNSVFGFAVGLLIVLITCASTYLLMQRKLRRELDFVRAQVDKAIDSRWAAAPRAAEQTPVAAAVKQEVASRNPDSLLKPSAALTSTKQSAEELAHETLVVIAAAVSAFLGKQVRLRSARLIQPSEGNAWAQQGRVFVQASHNLGLAHTHS